MLIFYHTINIIVLLLICKITDIILQLQYNKEDLEAQPALYLPQVDNLLKDNTDGCALAALLHFYCPTAVPLEGSASIHCIAIFCLSKNIR